MPTLKLRSAAEAGRVIDDDSVDNTAPGKLLSYTAAVVAFAFTLTLQKPVNADGVASLLPNAGFREVGVAVVTDCCRSRNARSHQSKPLRKITSLLGTVVVTSNEIVVVAVRF